MNYIDVEPARGNLVPFAKWATAQTPKINTSGYNSFAVPVPLFSVVPAELLEGSKVDGHEWVAPTMPDPSVSALDAVAPKSITRRARKSEAEKGD